MHSEPRYGMTYGDPALHGPEQARGEIVDRRADILLTRRWLRNAVWRATVQRPGTFDVPEQAARSPAPRLRDKRPDCPPWLESVIRTALAKTGRAIPDRGAVPRRDGTEKRACKSTATADAGFTGREGRSDEKLTPLNPRSDTAAKGQSACICQLAGDESHQRSGRRSASCHRRNPPRRMLTVAPGNASRGTGAAVAP